MRVKQIVVLALVFSFPFLTSVYSPSERGVAFRESGSEAQLQEEGKALLLTSTALDSFITATMSAYHIPGLSACIVKQGRLVWHHAYGYADVERRIPVTDSTLFDLASISKIITGTAIMQLSERGLINLDDEVNKYLPADLRLVNPYFPNIPITFKMILSSVASIGWDWNVMEKYVVSGDSPIPLFDFLKGYFVPGGAYYSATNYDPYPPGSTFNGSDHAGKALLGYLVEAITDTSFEEYCQKHIFAPLGMTETSWHLANLDTSHIARPYSWISSGYVPHPHRGIPWYPNGLLRTSSLQLARFLNAFMQKGTIDHVKILDSSTVALMTKAHYPQIALPSGMISMGLLWYQTYIGNRLTWGHWGSFSPGATTTMNYYEPEKIGVLILTNQDGADGVLPIRSTLFDYAAGIYLEPTLHVTADSLRFVSELYQPDTLKLIITNQGLDSLRIASVQTPTSHFHLTKSLPLPLVLGKDQNRELAIVFIPTDNTMRTDSLVLTSNDPRQPVQKVILQGVALRSAASGTIYAIADVSNRTFLATLNPADSGKASLIGSTGCNSARGLAVQPVSGHLFGVVPEINFSTFIKIDAQTGLAQNILTIPESDVRAMTFEGDTLWAASYAGKLFKIDLQTGVTKLVGHTGISNLSGLAFNPVTKKLWAASAGNMKLYILNRNTAQRTWERICFLAPHWLAFDGGGRLFGLFNPERYSNANLALLDTAQVTTGANDQIIGDTGIQRVSALAMRGEIAVAVRELSSIATPAEYALYQNYPNPFNPATAIAFALPQASLVTLKIYDLLGHEVATLVSEKLPAGQHQRVWEAKGLASGVYLYRIEAGDPSAGSGRGVVQTRKLVLLR
ncbi:MAG: D-aminopeptidase [bacterium]|nr:D-aminopeptidase [bacterium]